jgi:single-strand DNA-binding protein
MANLNRILLIGNLTRDPEVRCTPKGTAVADIGIAVTRVYSGADGEKKEEVTFVDVTLWGRQAEVAQEYLSKGRQVFVEGRLQLDTWDDKQTGQKRSRLRVVAETMQMLGAKPDQQQNRPATQKQPSQQRRTEPVPSAATASVSNPVGSNEFGEPDDIPF